MKNLTKKQIKIIYTTKGVMRKSIKKVINSVYGNIIHHTVTSFNCGYLNTVSIKDDLIMLLSALSLKYNEGNDAPRGGKDGDFIKISSRAIIKLKELNENKCCSLK